MLLKLDNTVLILINMGPSNVKHLKHTVLQFFALTCPFMHYCPLNSNRQQSVPSEQKGKPAKQAGRLYNNCCRSGYKSRVQGRGRRVEKKENHDEKKKVFTVVLSWLWRTSTYVRISTCVVVVVCIGKGRTERGETTWVGFIYTFFYSFSSTILT